MTGLRYGVDKAIGLSLAWIYKIGESTATVPLPTFGIPWIDTKGEHMLSQCSHAKVLWFAVWKCATQKSVTNSGGPFVLPIHAMHKKMIAHPDFQWMKKYASNKASLISPSQAFTAIAYLWFEHDVTAPMSQAHALWLAKAYGTIWWYKHLKILPKHVDIVY